ncbi:general substrate transporter [Rhizodiscina lignyota]|uniref:General substrate transporter n=1 Tax=Rhizodiscina lignyota TaxID=1504668 RepID=A0A9P4IEX0_9PEZI|nr:general substrate transporter [Rhizodiscina lignyota]
MRLWKHNFRGNALVFAITAASCQAFLLLGYDQGVMAGIIGTDNAFGKQFNNPDADLQGDITGLYDIGCVLGSIFCYFVGERFGRRTMLMGGGAIMIIGATILASSYTTAQLIVGRIVTGVGNGMNSSTGPVYLSECAPAAYRGALLTTQGTVTIFGVVIAYWTDYGTSKYSGSFEWRFPLGFQAVFAILLIIQIVGLPETPRWLMQQDRQEEARETVANLLDKPLEDPEVTSILLDIQSVIQEEHKGGPFHFRELLEMGKLQNFRRLLITISIELGQQFSGSNMINYYLPVILENSMGLTRNLSLILGGAAQCTYLVGSAIPVFVMDRFGRRNLLMWCSAGLSICFIVVAILLSLGTKGPAYGATAFIFIFQLVYGVGWLPVPWFYPSEINTTRVRSKMQAIASGWNWMAVFAVVKITPISFANIGWRTFIIFAVLNAAFVPMIYCFYPETKGLELEDIPLLFAKGGITGGVFTSRGKTVTPHQHAQELISRKVEVDTGEEEEGPEVKV